jgi:hypothetical protein
MCSPGPPRERGGADRGPAHRRPSNLVVQRPLGFDETLGLWVAASAGAVTAVLTSDLCLVRPPAERVPKALVGSAGGAIAEAGLEQLLACGVQPERLVERVSYRPSANTRIPLFGVPPDASELGHW